MTEDQPKSLYILDTMSMIMQAIFSPMRGQQLTGPTGEVTTGPYVFTRALSALCNTRKPDYMACALDAPRAKTFRRTLYPEYKATRDKDPHKPEIRSQIGRCKQILREMAVPRFELDDMEADDVIASLTRWGLSQGVDVTIVSRDKDFHQLISDRVSMLDPLSGDITTPESVQTRWGVGPECVAAVQALMGDSSDNIPGVAGIGQVYAKQLIKDHGTLEAAVRACRNDATYPTKATAKALIAASQDGTLDTMQRLVTLRTELEFGCDLEALRFRGLDFQRARSLFHALGFKRWAEWSKAS